MNEIFSVKSEGANGKRKCCCKKNSMNWAETKEAGPEGLGKLYNGSHICLPSAVPMLKTKSYRRKRLVENVFTTHLEDRREHRETTYMYQTLICCMKISTVSRCLRSR